MSLRNSGTPGPQRTQGPRRLEGSLPDRLEELARAIADGSSKIYLLPKDLPAAEAAAVRRRSLELMAEAELPHIGSFSLDAERAATRHCENFIGIAQVPMGVAGPLTVRGTEIDGDVYVPLATTEAALVASISRGCAALRQAGGARVYVEDVGMTRAPVFETKSYGQTQELIAWIQRHEGEIRRIAESTSRFLKVLDIRPFAFGTTLFLRFRATCGDAMGMNMVTIACDRVVSDYIVPSTGVPCIALSGNYCVDKKPAAINFQEGRGRRIHAEVVLSAEVLAKCLKTDAKSLVAVQYRKNLLGSIAAGAMGHNAHMANVVAAYFLATGQDLAHVVGASMGITNVELREPDSVYASIFLPDLPLGAVGGGTGLATQSEALSILGVKPDPDRPGAAVTRLGEVLGAAVLAGELSLLSAFTSRDLARAHEKLGRGKEVKVELPSLAASTTTTTAPPSPAATVEPAEVRVSAPGKVILMGEHAVVYGHPALVAALDLRAEAAISRLAPGALCKLELPAVGCEEEIAWHDITAYGAASGEAWRELSAEPSPARFARLRGSDPAHVVKVALAEAAHLLGGHTPPPFRLRLESRLPVGSGFGSSAATAAATAAALLRFCGHEPTQDELFRVSLDAERRQHGQPSGVDNATVLHGGLIWARRNASDGVDVEPLKTGSSLLSRLRLYDTGAPREATGAVVSDVRERMSSDPLRFESLFERLERSAWGLRQELSRERENPLRVVSLLAQAHAALCELGVVPEAVQELAAGIESRGGAAKISGAGALSGSGAGLLLVYHPNPDELASWSGLAAVARIEAALGAAGLRFEA